MSQHDESTAPPRYERSEEGARDTASEALAAFEGLAKMWPADAMEGMAKAFGAATGGRDDGGPSLQFDGDAGRAAMLMLKGYTLWTQQGIRYWSQLAELHGTYVQSLVERLRRMRDDPEQSEAERNALVDEAQRYLREVADVSMREGRVLRQELERLSGELRSEFGPPAETDGEPKRYVKAKP